MDLLKIWDLCLCFGLLWLMHGSALVTSRRAAKSVLQGTVFINGTASIARTDDTFVCATLDWWPPEKCDYGTCSWERASLLNLDLKNNILFNAIKAFSPLKIRMGGTLQDRVIYETTGSQQPCPPFAKKDLELFGYSQGCLPLSRWDELNHFLKHTGAVVTFGLNALSGRTINRDGSVTGAWNSSNAESLIQYTVSKGYKIHGWELGNELSGNGIGARITPDQYAMDINTLQNAVQTIYAGFEVKPLVMAPGGFFQTSWFTQFIDETAKSLQVVTHHIYDLGPGVNNDLVVEILNPTVLSGTYQTFSTLQSILESSGSKAVAWVGEAGGAYNSGHDHITNAFVMSFWYLDQLGMASSFNTKTYCRQSLIGGNYGLLNTTTFVPNPDYYSALLWHHLMGNKVLSTSFSGSNKIRAYTHCSKNTPGITVLLINLDSKATFQVRILTGDAWITRTMCSTGTCTREEYHLTPKDGDLQSQTVLLNGKVLTIDSSGAIPSLDPVLTSALDPINVDPFSIVFAYIPDINIPACK